MTKEQIFALKVQELIRKSGKLDKEAIGRVLILLDDARKDVMDLILDSRTRWQLSYYNVLKVSVERIMRDYQEEYIKEQSKILNEMVKYGIAIVDQPLLEIGFNRIIHGIDTHLIDILQGYSADLITNLTNDALVKINTEIRNALIGLKDPYDAMVAIGTNLDDKSVFSSIAKRAEVITRTEGGRVLQAARQARADEVLKLIPDMQKEWKHSLYAKQPRTGHEEAHGQRVLASEPFLIHWEAGVPDNMKEQLMYPKDPGGSPKNTINCNCYAQDWHPDWDKVINRQYEMDIIKVR